MRLWDLSRGVGRPLPPDLAVGELLPLLLPTGRPMLSGASGEKYTSLMSEPPMSSAMWLMQSASCWGSKMLGASRLF